MTVDTTRARLSALQAQITGVVTAYPNVPRSVLEVELPAFQTLVGRATYNRTLMGEQTLVSTRIYTQRLFIKTATLGIEGEAEDETTVFFDRVLDFFADRPQLQLDDGSTVVYSAQITTDSGVIILPYPSAGNTVKYFAAIDFPTEVIEVRRI